jgi:hypothetical protein
MKSRIKIFPFSVSADSTHKKPSNLWVPFSVFSTTGDGENQ